MMSFRVVAAAFLVIGLAAPVRAGLTLSNGGFETGDLAGWSATGDASVATAAVGTGPYSGTYQAFLTTASQNGDSNNFSGSDAVPAADLEAFLGLAAGTLGAGYEGSTVTQTFDASAGDVLRFRYKFLTTEGSRNDFAFVTLTGSPLTVLADTTAADLGPSAVVLDPVFGDPTRETPWRTFSFTFAAKGTYTLGVGVTDHTDEFVPSAILVDDVQVGPAAVPEPGTVAMAAGWGAVLAAGRLLNRNRARGGRGRV